MNAADIMVGEVVAVDQDTTVAEVARLLLEHHISGVPVIDGEGRVLGIVSEADLLPRLEDDAAHRRAWWLEILSRQSQAEDFVRSHARLVRDVMSPDPVTVDETTPIEEVAATLESHGIKRVPVLRQGRLVGIVSRANLLRALLARSGEAAAEVDADAELRRRFIAAVDDQPWAAGWYRNVSVKDGEIHLWGLVDSEAERRALCLLAETLPGSRGVKDHLIVC